MRIPSIYWMRLTWAAVAVAVIALPFAVIAPNVAGGITGLAMAMCLFAIWGLHRNDPTAVRTFPRWAVLVCVGVLVVSLISVFV